MAPVSDGTISHQMTGGISILGLSADTSAAESEAVVLFQAFP